MRIGATLVARAELARLLGTRGFALLLLVLSLASGVRAWFGASDLGTHGVEAGAAWHGLALGLRTGTVLAVLVLTFAAARGLAGDIQGWVVRLALTRSASRGGIIGSRLLVGLFHVLTFGLAVGIGAGLGAALGGDFGVLTIDGYELGDPELLHAGLVRVALLGLLGLLAVWSFGLLAGALTQSAVQAVALAFALLFVFDLFKELLGPAASWVFLTHTPTLLDSSRFEYLVELTGLGVSTAMWDEGAWRIGMVACPAWFLLCSLVAAWRLRSRSL